MSLEEALRENTAAVRELIAVLKAVLKAPAAPVEYKPTTAVAAEDNPTMPAVEPVADPAPTQPTAEAVADPAPSYKDVAASVTKLAREKGRDAALAVLTKFGAAKLPDVKPDCFAAVIAACEEAGI